MTHSAGPWRVVRERGIHQIKTAENESIMGSETYYPWVPDNPDDWPLIAAAPEMLKALKAVVTDETWGVDHPTYMLCKAAIRKAEDQT